MRELLHVDENYGKLAVPSIRSGDLLTLLMTHSNSSSSLIIEHITQSKVPFTRRVLALDLPGHGVSSQIGDCLHDA